MSKASSFAALGGLVYSTDSGRTCPECRQAENACVCAAQEQVLGDGRVRVSKSNKGRGGKTVTVVSGLALTAAQLKDVCTQLKKRCGVGGAVKEAEVEIQGDKVEVVLQWLNERGYQAKRSGG